jgi:hypothetical protein
MIGAKDGAPRWFKTYAKGVLADAFTVTNEVVECFHVLPLLGLGMLPFGSRGIAGSGRMQGAPEAGPSSQVQGRRSKRGRSLRRGNF